MSPYSVHTRVVGSVKMFKIIISICLLGSIVVAVQKSYDGFKVFRVSPEFPDQMKYLKNLESSEGIDFWDPIHFVANYPTRVMVSPEKIEFFKNYLASAGVSYELIIENVDEYILIIMKISFS